MRDRFGVSIGVLLVALALSQGLSAQSALPQGTAKNQGTDHVDLSGVWGNLGGSVPAAGAEQPKGPYMMSPKGTMQDAGTPADGVPYQPWAMKKLLAERPPSGPRATFDSSTDPNILYCELYGVPRIYNSPSKFKFVQTPEAVYILYEYGVVWRVVWLNRKHSDDPDPSYMGESIGWYEGKDTFVVDSIGFNDKTWLDSIGRPHSEKLHVIERFRRLSQDKLELGITIDDPGAYTVSWSYPTRTVASAKDFAREVWPCSVRENNEFNESVEKPTTTPGKK
ncbi:MAG: hypothetical protein LAO08_13010 [Acidobacteriia bacterium]|nr:hypothetical protein [Terriglobia bacterium]